MKTKGAPVRHKSREARADSPERPAPGELLRRAREAKGFSQAELARRAQPPTSPQMINRLESGARSKRGITRAWAERLAPALGIGPSELLFERTPVPLIGYVGAGAHYFPFESPDEPLEYVDPPKWANEKTVAVEIRGESLGMLYDRWIAFYDDVRNPPTDDLAGRTCVVGLDDGTVMIKKLVLGPYRDRYHLLSDHASPILDARVLWAAPVREIVSREELQSRSRALEAGGALGS